MGGRVARIVSGWWTVVAVTAGFLVLSAGPVSAHNSLTGSDPVNGARLAKAPAQIRLTFLARLDPGTTKITITGPDNVPAAGGAPTFAGSKVTVGLRAGAAGLYIVAYQVASGDGHPIKGEIRFTLTTGTAAASPSAAPTGVPSAGPSTAVVPSSSGAPSASPLAADSQGGTPWWPWVLGGALLLAALAGFVLRTRRRSTPTG